MAGPYGPALKGVPVILRVDSKQVVAVLNKHKEKGHFPMAAMSLTIAVAFGDLEIGIDYLHGSIEVPLYDGWPKWPGFKRCQ